MKKILFLLLFIAVQTLVSAQSDCNVLRISAANDGWIPCDNTVSKLLICNDSTSAYNFTQIIVTLPASLSFISSDPAPSLVQGQDVFYFLGTVPGQSCREITLSTAVSCAVTPGTAICLRARDGNMACPYGAPGWEGPDLTLTGTCDNNKAVFSVLNRGQNLPPGNELSYIIIEDHLMRVMDTIGTIDSGMIKTIEWPNPNGKTITFQMNPLNGHPYHRLFSASVEGCGSGDTSRGYLTQYPQYSGDLSAFIFCDTARNAISGFQKEAFPVGYREEHLIDRRTELQYRIRFQNLGNIAATTLTIRDTLSPDLNIGSFRVGAASHPYTYTLQNQILTVVFPNIQLPPFGVNEPGSRGYFSYHISPDPGVPSGTVILNRASVDMNAMPFLTITNETFHQIGASFVLTNTSEGAPPAAVPFDIQVIPNPVHTEAVVYFPDKTDDSRIELQLYNVAGQLLHRAAVYGNSYTLERRQLPPGYYLLRCITESGQVRTIRIATR